MKIIISIMTKKMKMKENVYIVHKKLIKSYYPKVNKWNSKMKNRVSYLILYKSLLKRRI